jgi:hypothetical protein
MFINTILPNRGCVNNERVEEIYSRQRRDNREYTFLCHSRRNGNLEKNNYHWIPTSTGMTFLCY